MTSPIKAHLKEDALRFLRFFNLVEESNISAIIMYIIRLSIYGNNWGGHI